MRRPGFHSQSSKNTADRDMFPEDGFLSLARNPSFSAKSMGFLERKFINERRESRAGGRIGASDPFGIY